MIDSDIIDGYTALKERDLKKAHECFSKALRRDSTDKERYFGKMGLSLIYRELGDLDKAIEEMKGATDCIKSPKEALYDLAMLYEEKGQFALSIQYYDLALSLDPQNNDAYNNRGIAWLKIPDIGQSLKDFRNALDGHEGASRVLCNIGMSYLSDRKYEKAIDNFDRSLVADETNIRALCGKGLALYYLDRYDDSMICFDAAIYLQPDFYIAFYYKGMILKKLDLLDEAEESLRKSLSIRDHFPMAWFELAEVQRIKGDIIGALGSYTKAIDLHPEIFEEALFNKGKLLYTKGKFTEALSCYRTILKKNGYVPSVWLEMGKTLLHIEDMKEKVLPVLNNALNLDPFNKETALILSSEYVRKNDFRKAYEVLKKVMDNHPDPEIGKEMGMVLFQLGKYKECIDISELTLSLDLDNIDILLYMGRAYGKVGRLEEYKQCLRRYLHKRPSDKDVEHEMMSLQ